MEDANARKDAPVAIPESPAGEKPAGEADGIAEETEFLPFTPGDDLPEEVEEVLAEASSPEGGRVAVPAESAPEGVGVPGAPSPEGVASSSPEKPLDELEELRAIFLGHAATGQLDIAQVAASMEDRLEKTRRGIAGELAAVERRLRDEIKGATTDLLSEVEERALLHRDAAEDSSGRADELLNLVSLTHENLRAELDKHHHETRHALDEVLSVVRELARTLVLLIGGNEEESPGPEREETAVIQREKAEPQPGEASADAPLLKELPAERGQPQADDGSGEGASRSDRAPGADEVPEAESSRAARAAKFFF